MVASPQIEDRRVDSELLLHTARMRIESRRPPRASSVAFLPEFCRRRRHRCLPLRSARQEHHLWQWHTCTKADGWEHHLAQCLWAHLDHQPAAPSVATLQHTIKVCCSEVGPAAAGRIPANQLSISLQMPSATERLDQPASIPAAAMFSATFLSNAVELCDAPHHA